jgi:hypothetical protein
MIGPRVLKRSDAGAVAPPMREIRRSIVALAVAGLSLTGGPAASRIPEGRLGVGDSIMLSAEDELAAFDVDVRAKVGRQFDEGLARIRSLDANGFLPKRVIVHLGTNGPIDPADCDALADIVGPSRRLFLVTIRVPRSWMKPNNATIRSCAEAHERVYLIRWSMVSGRHPEWFADDGYHLNADGQDRYARYLDAQVDAVLAAIRGAG